CYSPPNENLPLHRFNDILSRNSNTIFLGDLNAKHDSWCITPSNPKGRRLFEWLDQNDFQVINKFIPTSTRSKSTIDLILTPLDMFSGSFSVLPSIGSDHYPVHWTSPLAVPSKERLLPIKRTLWTLYELFITFTSSYWENLSTSMVDKIEFFCLYERFLSLSSSRLTYVSYCKSYKPSIPAPIIDLIQHKRHYLHLVRKTKHPYYITQLKLLTQQIRKAMFVHKRHMWSEYCKSFNTYDVKQFWRKAGRHFSSHCSPIEGILKNGSVVTSPMEMCNIAQQFYMEQFAEHEDNKSSIDIEADLVDQDISIELQNSKCDIINFKVHDVMKAIKSLKNKNSTGLDGVSNRIIKLLPSSHLTFITSSFNHMVQNVCIPRHWLTAKMILLSKTKTSIVDINDTRPISLLPCFSKLYEKLFLVLFRQWISDNGFLPDEQTGFRPGHNMSTRIVSIVDQIESGLALNTATAALFVDFKSAFNQLWIKGLWIKLKRLNCPIYIIAWLRNYLLGRSAFVELKGTKSNIFPLFKGVPQGSCIGPVLFIIYHYDILNAVSNLHFKHLFADDLAIVILPSATWASNVLILYLAEQISKAINDLHSYAIKWKQPLNFKKTYWTLFNCQPAPIIPTVYCQNNLIEQVAKFKYLGVILDARLSFNYHLDYIKSKINKNIVVFKRLSGSRMLSPATSLRLYHAYIRPYYQSILNIFPVLSRTNQQQLEGFNRKIFRIIHRWEYYLNPDLLKEKQAMVSVGRTSNRINELLEFNKKSLFDLIFCFS
ncbi:unnamed protein product, partial [Adineta steineri]